MDLVEHGGSAQVGPMTTRRVMRNMSFRARVPAEGRAGRGIARVPVEGPLPGRQRFLALLGMTSVDTRICDHRSAASLRQKSIPPAC